MTTRVLHITRDAPPRYNGGISTALGMLCEATERFDGIEHRVVSFDAWKPGDSGDSVPLETEDDTIRLTSPSQLGAAGEWAKDQRPHVIHVHDPFLWEFGRELRTEIERPLIYTAHVVHDALRRICGIAGETKSSSLEEEALRQADRVHVATNYAKGLLPEEIREKTHVLPWPIRVDALKDAEGSVLEAPRIWIASRFAYIKGTDRAPSLLAALQRRSTDTRITWFGGLRDSPKRERRWLRRLHQAGGQSPPPNLDLAGWHSREEMLACYRPADLFLSFSRHETFGLAAAEAMARGCAIVAFRCGGIEEICGNSMALLLDDKRPAEQHAEEIASLIASPARRSEAAISGYSRIRELGDPKRTSARFLALYRDVTGHA